MSHKWLKSVWRWLFGPGPQDSHIEASWRGLPGKEYSLGAGQRLLLKLPLSFGKQYSICQNGTTIYPSPYQIPSLVEVSVGTNGRIVRLEYWSQKLNSSTALKAADRGVVVMADRASGRVFFLQFAADLTIEDICIRLGICLAQILIDYTTNVSRQVPALAINHVDKNGTIGFRGKLGLELHYRCIIGLITSPEFKILEV